MSRVRQLSILIIIIIACFLLPAFGFSSDLVSKGEESLLKGEFNQAAEYLKSALDDDSQNARILHGLGRAYFHLKKYSMAEDKLKQSLSSSAQEEWIRCWSTVYLGRINTLEKEYLRAFEYFKQAGRTQESSNCRKVAAQYTSYLNAVTYAQGNLQQKHTTHCCTLYYGKDSPAEKDVASISQTIQDYYETIFRVLRLETGPSPVQIYLYPSSATHDLWQGREIFALNNRGEIHVHYNGAGDAGQIEHEMVHIMSESLFDKAGIMPLLSEGLAEYVVGDPWGIALDTWVNEFRQEGRFVSLGQLTDRQRFRQVNPVVSYEEAGSFVKFLIENYGFSAFLELLDHNATFEGVLSKSLARLEMEWLHAIDDIKIASREKELINYRLWHGEFFNDIFAGKKKLPWLGISYKVLGEEVIIDRVDPSSPARTAGLRVGDVLKKVEETEVNNQNSWKVAGIAHKKMIGDKISLTIERKKDEIVFVIVLGENEMEI